MICPFQVGSTYFTDDTITGKPVYAYVNQVHHSGRAVFALIFDHTWGFLSFRWCRVGRFTHTHFLSGRYSFDVRNFVKDSACIPPADVLDFLASRA